MPRTAFRKFPIGCRARGWRKTWRPTFYLSTARSNRRNSGTDRLAWGASTRITAVDMTHQDRVLAIHRASRASLEGDFRRPEPPRQIAQRPFRGYSPIVDGDKKRRAEARPGFKRNKVQKQQRSAGHTHSRPNLQRPKPVVCIDCREMSAVDAMPCIRSLNSSAFEAHSRAAS